MPHRYWNKSAVAPNQRLHTDAALRLVSGSGSPLGSCWGGGVGCPLSRGAGEARVVGQNCIVESVELKL